MNASPNRAPNKAKNADLDDPPLLVGQLSAKGLTDRTDGHTIAPTMSEIESQGRLLSDALAPYVAGEPAATFVKLSISLPADVVDVVRAAATDSGLSVSATIAAALRRTLGDAEQARLDAALEAQAEENLEIARAYGPITAELLAKLEW